MTNLIKTPPAKKEDAGRGNNVIKTFDNSNSAYVILYLDENNIVRATTFNIYNAEKANDYIKLINPKFKMIAITFGKIHQEL